MSNAEHLANVMVEAFIAAVERGVDLVPVVADSTSTAKIAPFIKQFPGRLVNVGIAEQSMVGTAAGLALGGKVAVTCNAAPFLISRANEQIKVDVCYNNTNVKLFGLNAGASYGPLASRLHGPGNVFYVCAPTPLQHALSRVLMAEPAYYDAQREEFGAKRARATAALERIGFRIYPSASSFYLWARIPQGFGDAMQLNAQLLEREGVAGVPGSAFADDPSWNQWMRLCIARTDELLDGALARIERALA